MNLTPLVLWSAIYCLVKGAGRLRFGQASWDLVCLFHNALSVLGGIISLYRWPLSETDTCNNIASPTAFVIYLQAIHCVTDCVFYAPSLLDEPVFIAHHLVLFIASLILPQCPACYHTVLAFTIAELGSGAIAIDSEWRKLGLHSRGAKRLVFFGGSRIVNLYFLYHILKVTPFTQYYTLSSRGSNLEIDEELFTINVPVCLLASLVGSGLMLLINGITWFRMLGAYAKRHRGNLLPRVPDSRKTAFKAMVDLQLFVSFGVCFCVHVVPHLLPGWSTQDPSQLWFTWVLVASVGIFLAEPSITAMTEELYREDVSGTPFQRRRKLMRSKSS